MTKRIRPAWRIALAAAAVASGGCADAGQITSPAPASLFSCLFGAGLDLEPGEVSRLEGERAAAACLTGEAGGADYVYIPFNASKVGTARLRVEVTGGGTASSIASSQARFGGARLSPRPDPAFHHGLRLRELRELSPPAARAALEPIRPRVRAAASTVGDLIPINTSASCQSPQVRTGRVEAVSATAVIVADVENPPGGFDDSDWAFFAAAFDTLIDPVVTEHFGEPTDIDDNGRVIVFFTSAVNQLTEPGSGFFVGGFFWAGDLFPRSECPGSNQAEVFYLRVPDPERARTESAFEIEFVRRSTLGTVGHEYQHLINAGRRIHVTGARSLEEVWLNEGLSHIAEEVLYYASSGLAPRQNLGLDDVRATERALEAFRAFGIANFGRFLRYLEDPSEESLMGEDNLPTRGAAWAFLRYAADREPRPDAELFRALVDGPAVGVTNLNNALGEDAVGWMQDWTVSVFTDDFPDLEVQPIFTQPSWNFRSIMPALARTQGYPLEVLTPGAGATTEAELLPGGAAFVRFGVQGGGRAFLSTTSGGAIPPGGLRVSIVRIR